MKQILKKKLFSHGKKCPHVPIRNSIVQLAKKENCSQGDYFFSMAKIIRKYSIEIEPKKITTSGGGGD